MLVRIIKSVVHLLDIKKFEVIDIIMESNDGNSSQNNGNSNEEPNTASLLLLSLNEDCLLKILDYLYIVDTVNLALTCKTFMIVARKAVKKFKRFDLTEYQCYVEKNKRFSLRSLRHRSTLPLAPILFVISPCIESLNLNTTYLCSDLLIETGWQLIKKITFPNMKTLTVRNSGALKWLTVNHIEELDLRRVDQHGLGNFANEMTKLKKLTINEISKDVQLVEIYDFLKRNRKIECLKMEQVLPFDFKIDILPRLRHLTELQLTFGKNIPDLTHLLRIEKLSVLRLKFDDLYTFSTGAHNYARLILFLKMLSAKKTIDSIDFSGMLFINLDIFNDFSDHLVSLRLIDSVIRVDGFYWQLANIPFLRLKHLDIETVSHNDTMCLIKHLKTLERFTMVICNGSRGNTPEFLEQLKLLLGHESRTSQAFELEMTTNMDLHDKKVKVSA